MDEDTLSVIIVGLMLPSLNGLEVICQVRRRARQTQAEVKL